MGSISAYDQSDVLDVLIVGGGISGINCAYRLKDECPDKKYMLLENRDQYGGTWDLFKYPGIRSDSDLHTFGYAFKEWTGADIAEGSAIKAYLNKVADENGIREKTRFNHKVVKANFSSEERCWYVDAESNGQTNQYRARFLFLGTGYYDYNEGLKVDIPGISNFKGKVVHPQFWDVTEDDYRNKNVIVIGSGATAITLLPNMAPVTKSTTLLQRSPSYIVSLEKFDPIAKVIRTVLPRKAAAYLIRQKNIVRIYASYHLFRTFPRFARAVLRRMTKSQLPKSVPLDPHFNPRYNPWDQRLCICPDGDFYETLHEGKAKIATGYIQNVESDKIVLKSGEQLPADLIVTATGLKIKVGGDIAMHVDGKPVDVPNKFAWRSSMLEDVPNMLLSIGYVNASWTLGSDCTCKFLCRTLKYLDQHHKSLVVAKPENREAIEERPLLNLTSTYVKEASGSLPKAGATGPWKTRTNYWVDMYQAKFGSLEGLTFA